MKTFKETAKRMAYILLIEVILMGVLSFIVDRFLISFISEWPLWKIALLLGAVLVISGAVYLIYTKIKQYVKKRARKAIGKRVEALQLEVICEFVSLHEQKIDENSSDVAAIANMLLGELNSQCRIGSNFNMHIRSIREDYNMLAGCKSQDSTAARIAQLAAIKDLQGFLIYLSVSAWNHPDKLSFTEKYLQQAKALADGLFKDMVEGEKQEIEFKSNRLNYLQRLCDERECNLTQYLPLAYKSQDDSLQRYSLSELSELAKNKAGFVLYADAGYGKSWSIIELAGAHAKRAQLEEIGTPILIKMGQVTESDQPIVKTVQEILFPGDGDLERARKFLQTQKTVLYVDGMDEASFKNKEAARRELLNLIESCEQLRIIGATRGADREKFPSTLASYSIFDLSDEQVREFIAKQITDPELLKKANYDYFDNKETAFLRNLRSPFYLKCFVDFILEGESNPTSDTDMVSRCIDKMLEREIKIKGFAATVCMLNEFLRSLSKILDKERYLLTVEVIKKIKQEWVYDGEEYASLIGIKDTLVELGLLSEESPDPRGGSVLGFKHEKYKNLYSPIATNSANLDW